MDFFDVIKKRYSYRGKFKEEKIAIEDLKKIVEVGLMAPSGKNQQTTSFMIVNDDKKLNLIRKTVPIITVLQTAPALIACIVDKEPENIYLNYSFQIEDCAAAVQNMLLAISALGYSSVWLDGILRRDDNFLKIGNILNIPNNKRIQILLPVGKETEEGKRPQKKNFEERVCINNYSL